jgi:hypothetical protein
MNPLPIDAVITWVDGNDPLHEKKLTDYLASQGIQRPEAAAPTRFNQRGELDYCVWSLLRFAPWLRTIFIVTDNQTPPIIEQLLGTPYENKIKLIDHRTIFSDYETALPTFNSLTIECMLWRIEGLSEQFIYLNDDCALIRPMSPRDFFRNKRLILRGQWKTQTPYKWQNHVHAYLRRFFKKNDKTLKASEHRVVQENSAKQAGFRKKFFYLPHIPFPVNKTTLSQFFLDNPDLLSKNIHHPFRDSQQFWPISLAYHLDIAKKRVIFNNRLKGITLHGSFHPPSKIDKKLARAEKKNVVFMCIQSMDSAPQVVQDRVFRWLEKMIMA